MDTESCGSDGCNEGPGRNVNRWVKMNLQVLQIAPFGFVFHPVLDSRHLFFFIQLKITGREMVQRLRGDPFLRSRVLAATLRDSRIFKT